MALYILGINAHHGDSAAVLLADGQILAAVEEERLRRVKHWAGFPSASIRRCLEIAGIDGGEVSHVAVSRNPRAHLLRKGMFTLLRRPNPRHVADRARNAARIHGIRNPLADALGAGASGRPLPRLHFIEHHQAHLASAFFVSPFEEAAVCAVDGFGDFVSTSVASGSGNGLRVLQRTFFPHSLGILYSALTQYLGFDQYGDEFKVMGLAPYGRPEYVAPLRRLVRLERNGRFRLDLKYFRHASEGVAMEWSEGGPTLGRLFSPELEKLLGPPRSPGTPLTAREEDLAASLQQVYEECVLHVINDLWERTKSPRLALAGGCAMNSVANGKLRAQTRFRELYVQPAAADNGTALGAAYDVWHTVLGRPRAYVMDHAFWGPDYPGTDVDALLRRHAPPGESFNSTRFEGEAELCRAVARVIAAGGIVGWHQGRMEFGARALGNRSILGDPRRADLRAIINAKIKFREKFRPFAPAILEESVDDYFVDAAPDPFMQQVYPIRPERWNEVPAVTHVDGTGRLQVVDRRTNPRFHQLIREFAAISGVPMLLNTSFNENEPIVDTPEQALDCFLRTRMDALVIDRVMICRPSALASAQPVHPSLHGDVIDARSGNR